MTYIRSEEWGRRTRKMRETVKKRKTWEKKVYSGTDARYDAEEVSSLKHSDWQSVLAYLNLSWSPLRILTTESLFILLDVWDRQTLSMLRITRRTATVPLTNRCDVQICIHPSTLSISMLHEFYSLLCCCTSKPWFYYSGIAFNSKMPLSHVSP